MQEGEGEPGAPGDSFTSASLDDEGATRERRERTISLEADDEGAASTSSMRLRRGSTSFKGGSRRGDSASDQLAPAIPADEAAIQRARDQIGQLLSAGKPAVDEAKATAASAEATLVYAMEAAIAARQESSHVKVALEKARAEEKIATEREKAAAKMKTLAGSKHDDASKVKEKAQAEVEKAGKATREAERRRASAQADVAAAEKATAEATEKHIEAARDSTDKSELARSTQHELKEHRKVHEAAMARAEKAVEDEKAAETAITRSLQSVEQKEVAAKAASKRASELRDEEQMAARSFETAKTAAKEFEGQGGTWEERTQKTVREREAEHKRTTIAYSKAAATEDAQEQAVSHAEKEVQQCKDDLVVKQEENVNAKAALETSAETLGFLMGQSESADKEAAVAKDVYETADKELKAKRHTQQSMTVAKADEALHAAKQLEKHAAVAFDAAQRAFDNTADVLERTTGEAEAALQLAAAEREKVEKASGREKEADDKESAVAELITALEDSVYELALTVYEARTGAAAWWLDEDGKNQASIVRGLRRAAAQGDVKNVAAGKAQVGVGDKRASRMSQEQVGEGGRAYYGEITCVDKWRIYRHWLDDQMSTDRAAAQAVELNIWNVRKMFYTADGNITSQITLMVSDVLGSALDRGLPSARMCKIEGEGLTHGEVGHVSSFVITACSAHGIRFDDGGDTFNVSVRFAGMGIRVIAKIIDNSDGSYTVSFKPPTNGRCIIRVTMDGEELPGSPFTCVVAGISGPMPVAKECHVHGPALQQVVARVPEQFFIGYRDQAGHVAHACDLDVWVQPIDPELYVRPTATGSVQSVLGAVPAAPPAGIMQLATLGVEQITADVAQVLAPLGEFESLVVGAQKLDVTRSIDEWSERIGKLKPGSTLKIYHVEEPRVDDEGRVLIRACVRLELQDLEPRNGMTWRQHWHTKQPWRSLSWRAHCIGEARREEEEGLVAAALLMKTTASRQFEAARRLQSVYRGRGSRRRVAEVRQVAAEEAMIAAEEAALAAEAQRAADKEARRKSGMGPGAQQARGSKSAPPPAPAKATPAKATPAKSTPAAKGGKGDASAGRSSITKPGSAPAAASTPTGKSGKGDAKPKDEKEGGSSAKRPKGSAPASAAKSKDDAKGGKAASEVKAEDKAEAKAAEKTKVEKKEEKKDDRKDVKKDDKKEAKVAKPEPKAKAEAKDSPPKKTKKTKALAGAPTSSGADGDVGTAPEGTTPEAKEVEEQAKAATRIQAASRGSHLRKRRRAEAEEVAREKAAADEAAAASLNTPSRRPKAGTRVSKPEPTKGRSPARVRLKAGSATGAFTTSAALRPSVPLPVVRVPPPVKPSPSKVSGRPSHKLSKPQLDLGPLEKDYEAELYGWVTLVAGGESRVSKQTGRLPAHLRQRYEQHWNRRNKIDSDREREVALKHDQELETELDALRAPHFSLEPRPLEPRPAYWDDMQADPRGIGFAYGGVNPGRLHAKGQLVDQHAVQFSIGTCGTYLLYVALRQPRPATVANADLGQLGDWQVPGSPFLLKVAPGPPYPLSTQIPYLMRGDRNWAAEEAAMEKFRRAESQSATVVSANAPTSKRHSKEDLKNLLRKPLEKTDTIANLATSMSFKQVARSVSGTPAPPEENGPASAADAPAPSAPDGLDEILVTYFHEEYLVARDKVGNPCESGGADITCGFLKGGGRSPRHMSSTMSSTSVLSQSGSDHKVAFAPEVADDDEENGRSATCEDMGDGTYRLTWQATTPATYDVFVKMDGLHVIGSPARLVLKEQEREPPPASTPDGADVDMASALPLS